jgi:hypothetical protein
LSLKLYGAQCYLLNSRLHVKAVKLAVLAGFVEQASLLFVKFLTFQSEFLTAGNVNSHPHF